MTQLNLSARAYHRTLRIKLARTITDLAGCEDIQSVHLAEALHASQSAEFDDREKGLDCFHRFGYNIPNMNLVHWIRRSVDG